MIIGTWKFRPFLKDNGLMVNIFKVLRIIFNKNAQLDYRWVVRQLQAIYSLDMHPGCNDNTSLSWL